jgi:nitrate reductase alpha subunit
MSYLLDQLRFFKRGGEPFADGHGVTRSESRDWENGYRARWQYDKIVRSTHGVNCTGSAYCASAARQRSSRRPRTIGYLSRFAL